MKNFAIILIFGFVLLFVGSLARPQRRQKESEQEQEKENEQEQGKFKLLSGENTEVTGQIRGEGHTFNPQINLDTHSGFGGNIGGKWTPGSGFKPYVGLNYAADGSKSPTFNLNLSPGQLGIGVTLSFK